MRLSARNQLAGTVVSLTKGVVTAEVVVRIDGGHEIIRVHGLADVGREPCP